MQDKDPQYDNAVAEDLPDQKPSRIYANSRTSRIANLQVGESVAESVRLPLETATREAIRSAVSRLKGSFSRLVSTVTERTGQVYKSETAQVLTQSGDILIIQVVTRAE